jgi:hypothetical protein
MTTPSARETLARLIELDDQAPTGFEIGTDPQWLSDWYQAIHQARQALAPEVAIPGEQYPAAAHPGGADPITQRGPMSTPRPRTDAAQAVYEAAHEAWVTKDDPERIAAATIRALVTNHGTKTMGGIILNGDAVLDIATELEQQA